ncbi:threonine--tRNA ligase [bacterium]|nr:threonine--tRNA ligase [bacterium]
MRILLVHADKFSYHVTEKTSAVSKLAELEETQMKGELGESLVAFMASEKIDERGIESVAKQAAETIAKQAEQLSAKTIMLYPYAHLSSDLSSPRVATKVLARVRELMMEAGEFEVREAPFGFYKGFDIVCKGHPLSELSKTIVPAKDEKGAQEDEHASEAIKAEKELTSDWRIYTADGEDVAACDFDLTVNHSLKSMCDYEFEGSRAVTEPPAHIELMRRLELVDYEPASDSGNMRWYPQGQLIKWLAEEHVSSLTNEYGAMRVETPIMYDYQHPNLKSYLNRFPARQYVVISDQKEFFLRFAACFGQYMMQHDMQLSHRMLPCRLYEISHYSFRREQTGELAGLRRLRTFTMPDLHTLTRDLVEARKEFLQQMELAARCLDDFGLKYEVAVRFVRSFLDEDPEFGCSIAKQADRPVLVEIWDERFFYFVAKLEFNFVDAQGKAFCLSTVQIDVENTERFDISYVDEDGQKKRPVLMHTSVSGAIDRVLCAILEQQAMKIANKEVPMLPIWLAPTQVRIIPVAERHNEFCESLLAKIPYRADFDDREMSVGKKIRDAGRHWIPFTCVVGDNEIESGKLTVRVRGGEQEEMSVDHLNTLIEEKIVGKPYKPLNVSARLSERPIFVG